MVHTSLKCPKCEIISPIPREDEELIRHGAKILVDCPVCQNKFTGQLSAIWTFHPNQDPEGRYPPNI